METATERIIRLLLTHPKRKWKQIELSRYANCSKVFVNKFTKRLISQGILVELENKQIKLLSFNKLLNMWCGLRKLETPIYIKTKSSHKNIIKKLKNSDNYALTLLSAAWIRMKFMKTNKMELYVPKKDIKKFMKKIGTKSKQPTNIIIFPCDEYVFEGLEKINSLNLVSVVQNYVDLVSCGGTGVRVALKLAEKYNLLGV